MESNKRTNYNFESKKFFHLVTHSLNLENYTMIKLIEMLVHLNIPLHVLFEYLTKTDYVRKLFYYYAQQKPSKKVIPLLSYKNAVLESQICYLAYVYSAYTQMNIKDLKKACVIR